MRSLKVVLCATLSLGVAACGDSTAPPMGSRQLAAQVQGKWAEKVSFPGISLVLNLAAQDTVLTGPGTYSIEAGRSGTLGITGVASGQMVKLDLSYDYGPRAHFEGSLQDQNTLSGLISYGPALPPGGTPFQITFQRKQVR
ncbi:MAG TPA: hypothetical protein VHE78_13665 [Gemmatimonadaceae bacterium]|nr:hypothetical protein [Gemmatimonadaceae bacterium]